MVKKTILFILLLILVISFSSATRILVSIDTNEYSGGILKIEDVNSGQVSEKIYPSFVNEELIEFSTDIIWAQINLDLKLLNNGEIVLNQNLGPYPNTGDINIDLAEPPDEELENLTTLISEENLSDEVVEVEMLEDSEDSEETTKEDRFFLTTAKAIFIEEGGSMKSIYFYAIGAILLFVVLLVVLKIRSGPSGEDRELLDAEKRIKFAELEINKIEERKRKISQAKERLKQDEERLGKLRQDESVTKQEDSNVE